MTRPNAQQIDLRTAASAMPLARRGAAILGFGRDRRVECAGAEPAVARSAPASISHWWREAVGATSKPRKPPGRLS
jgi:hypothetical protein